MSSQGLLAECHDPITLSDPCHVLFWQISHLIKGIFEKKEEPVIAAVEEKKEEPVIADETKKEEPVGAVEAITKESVAQVDTDTKDGDAMDQDSPSPAVS